MPTPHRILILTALLSAALAGCVAPTDDHAIERDDRAIVGGSATTDYPAVPYLGISYDNGEGGGCTGTLVSPRVILTAAHCVDPSSEFPGASTSSVYAYFGSKLSGSDDHFLEQIDAEDWTFIEDWTLGGGDMALVLLAHDAPAEPLPYNTQSLSSAFEGAPLHLVGWGNTSSSGGSGTKRHVTASIGEVFDWRVEYGTASANTCQGDSGGPGFLPTNGGGEVVATVTSWGTGGCLGNSGAGRVDRFTDWIDSYVTQNDVPIPPTVSFVTPEDGQRVKNSFQVHVEAEDNTRVERLELWIDGAMVEEIPTSLPPYVVRAELEDGPAAIEVRAYDNRGDTGSAMVDVTVDSSCQNADECGLGYDCQEGSCVAIDAGTGDLCEINEECAEGICASLGDESRCTVECTVGDDMTCPEGLECLGDETGYCWPGDGGGDEGGCAIGGRGSRGALWLLAIAALLARRRRGRG